MLVDDTYPQPEVGPTNYPGPGVRDNDDIPCGNKALLSVTSPPAHGSVMLSNNGGFRYTPYSKPNQFDMFEYKVGAVVVWQSTTGLARGKFAVFLFCHFFPDDL